MKFNKVKNYVEFAQHMKKHFDVEKVDIDFMGKGHYHYKLFKHGLQICIICYNEGELTISPFDAGKSFNNDGGYISSDWIPLFAEMAVIFEKFSTLVNIIE